MYAFASRSCSAILPPMSPLEILRRGGEVSDQQFDAVYPDWVRDLSDMFWTPVAVAIRAAQLLAPDAQVQVLDVGAGVGKFCHIGAVSTGAVFHGIEQRLELVEVAKLLPCPEPRPVFEFGNMLDHDWDDYQGIYLYNPFFEQTSGPWCQIDDRIQYSRETQLRYVDAVCGKLEAAKVGTRVATYFGFGAKLPDTYRQIAYEQYEKGPLEVWIKVED
jgi:hypothetical protein